jgi:hypothetical protein
MVQATNNLLTAAASSQMLAAGLAKYNTPAIPTSAPMAARKARIVPSAACGVFAGLELQFCEPDSWVPLVYSMESCIQPNIIATSTCQELPEQRTQYDNFVSDTDGTSAVILAAVDRYISAWK